MHSRHYYKLPDDDHHQMVSCATYALVMLFLIGTLVFVLLKVARVI